MQNEGNAKLVDTSRQSTYNNNVVMCYTRETCCAPVAAALKPANRLEIECKQRVGKFAISRIVYKP